MGAWKPDPGAFPCVPGRHGREGVARRNGRSRRGSLAPLMQTPENSDAEDDAEQSKDENGQSKKNKDQFEHGELLSVFSPSDGEKSTRQGEEESVVGRSVRDAFLERGRPGGRAW